MAFFIHEAQRAAAWTFGGRAMNHLMDSTIASFKDNNNNNDRAAQPANRRDRAGAAPPVAQPPPPPGPPPPYSADPHPTPPPSKSKGFAGTIASLNPFGGSSAPVNTTPLVTTLSLNIVECTGLVNTRHGKYRIVVIVTGIEYVRTSSAVVSASGNIRFNTWAYKIPIHSNMTGAVMRVTLVERETGAVERVSLISVSDLMNHSGRERVFDLKDPKTGRLDGSILLKYACK